MNAEKSPKVFFSYSWSSNAHQQRVLDLAKRLIADGVDVVLDKFDLKEGQDLHAFMERMVNDKTVTHVIVVTDRHYAEKANNREKGVGKEALIISAEVYEKADQTKFLPVVFETADGTPCVPTFMKGRIFVDMSTPERENENYEGLVRRLFGKPLHQKPALGKPPAFLLEANAITLPASAKAQTAKDAVLQSKPFTEAAIEDYFSVFADSLELLRVAAKGEDPLDERVMASINSFLPYRDEFLGLVEFLAAYRDTDHTYETIIEFFERASRYLSPPEGMQSWDDRWFDNYRFILGELFIHVAAVLLRKKRFSRVAELTGREYRIARELGEDRWQSFTVFFPGTKSLERDRQQRLKTKWASATAEALKNRATGKPISFEELMQAELVLFLRSLIDDRTRGMWIPYTLLYRQRWLPFDIFARAESAKYFENLKALFGVKSKEEFVKRVSDAGRAHNMPGAIFLANSISPISYEDFLNAPKLATRP